MARNCMPPSAPTAISPRTGSRPRPIAPPCSKWIAPAASGGGSAARAGGQWGVSAPGWPNPNGASFQPQSGALWVTVNERDELGNDLVPDYMTSVQDGGFYGWPLSRRWA